MDSTSWQFWIDIGGTFTDCIAYLPGFDAEDVPPHPKRVHPFSNQILRRHKLLSSALTPGIIQSVNGLTVYDERREAEIDGFWSQATFRIADQQKQTTFEATILQSHPGSLELSQPLPYDCQGLRYEIVTDVEAPIIGIHHLLEIPLQESLPPIRLRLGTTRGTNALLTRTGARTLFVTTRGFKDILKIGNQDRPDLFALDIKKYDPLYDLVFEASERIDTYGNILTPLDLESVIQALENAKASGIQSIAICLMNAFACAQHECIIEELARKIGFDDISRSSKVSPLIKIVSRADTTVLNSYLNPVLTKYIRDITHQLHPESSIRLLTSAGGLVGAEKFSGRDSILSGPAGGVVGFSSIASQAGFEKAIGFDMGGTSTDVSRFDGHFEYEYETQKDGVRIVTPMLAIETVAAGGGSVCGFDGIKLTVGPNSAGSDPGPACYGRGGPLTVTDLNLVLGRIRPEQFSIPLRQEASIESLRRLGHSIEATTGHRYEIHELAEAFLNIANHNMAQAIGNISVAKGYDPADYALVSFGGAAAQHACGVARLLNISTILNHPDGGILSAYGIGQANVKRQADLGIYRQLNQALLQELEHDVVQTMIELQRQVESEGYKTANISLQVTAELRLLGVDATLQIPISERTAESFDWNVNYEQLTTLFSDCHLQRYGFTPLKSDPPSRQLELVTLRIVAIGQNSSPPPLSTRSFVTTRKSQETTTFFQNGQRLTAQCFSREDLTPGDQVTGPAIITEQFSTTLIEPGWNAEVLSNFELLIESDAKTQHYHHDPSTTTDPAMLEIFNNHFVSIANQMGLTLQNTSNSVNVKERLDFSCAIFTAEGQLVVNAPHIPVHLGAMGESVRAILDDHDSISPGDVFITNDPYRGGSHLPDVTIVTPVFNLENERIFFTASRAHHSEIGGCTPGSMPPFSQTLAEEGVLIKSRKLINAGESEEHALQLLLEADEFPSRSVDINLADIQAQVAANHRGAHDLKRMIERYGESTVLSYMRSIQEAASAKMRQALSKIPDGVYYGHDSLDEHFNEDYDAEIKVAITIQGDTAELDFTGTSPVLPNNLNANQAIVTAAVLYVLRLLIDEPIPLNQGVLEPITLILPECFLNPTAGLTAADSPAVVGGNVETSQRIVDVLLSALELAAASQGTMNNLLFGDETFGYYETICGGAGATARSPGADAVHTHMTNTRITDPEILERRYPVQLNQFSIREQSGGQGIHSGGNGIIRKMTFLQPVTVSLLTQRRDQNAPPGLNGGEAGKAGVNRVIFADGREQKLSNRQQLTINSGDQLTIETPGGGGWGSKHE